MEVISLCRAASAIVTGGSKGLGLAIAQEYARSGADVMVLARDQGALNDARALIQMDAKGKVLAISCDVSKKAPIEAAIAQCNKEFGKVDIFVNNAGQSTRGPSETITDQQWQADLDLKLFAQIRFCRILMPQDEVAEMGPHHQRPQYRRQGSPAPTAPRPRSAAPRRWR